MASGDAAQQRPFDLTIFGATGFTGAFVAIALARLQAGGHSALPRAPLRVALAGRSAARLRALLERIAAEVPGFAAGSFSLLVADVADEPSLAAMAQQSALLLNCVGPFRKYGEPVVAACVAARTHYLDIVRALAPSARRRRRRHSHSQAPPAPPLPRRRRASPSSWSASS